MCRTAAVVAARQGRGSPSSDASQGQQVSLMRRPKTARRRVVRRANRQGDQPLLRSRFASECSFLKGVAVRMGAMKRPFASGSGTSFAQEVLVDDVHSRTEQLVSNTSIDLMAAEPRAVDARHEDVDGHIDIVPGRDSGSRAGIDAFVPRAASECADRGTTYSCGARSR